MHATIVVTYENTRSYTKHTPKYNFIPLAIETYGCFHSCFNSFFTTCVHATIAYHQRSFLIPTMFISYYQQYFHNHLACTSHSDFLTCYHAWKAILISSTHLNYCTSIIDQFVIDNTFFLFHLISVLVVSWLLCSFMTCVLELLFTLYILWMGSHPYLFKKYIYKVFFRWSFVQ
jgi:hypothetical protein